MSNRFGLSPNIDLAGTNEYGFQGKRGHDRFCFVLRFDVIDQGKLVRGSFNEGPEKQEKRSSGDKTLDSIECTTIKLSKIFTA